MNKLCVLILLFSSAVSFSQKRSDLLDPTSFNKDFLEKCILEELNSAKNIQLEENESLKKLAKDFQLEFESKHFYSAKRYQLRIDKEISLKSSDELNYEGSLVVSAVSSIDIINYEGGDFHYHRADKLSTLHLYYGEREKANQIEEKLIPLDSYESLSKKIVQKNLSGDNKKTLKSSAYKDVGLSVSLDYKTLYRSKIPQIKVIMILGGDQTALLRDLAN